MGLRPFLKRRGSGERVPPAPPDPIPAIIEAMSDPLIVVDGFQISHANAAARALLGAHIVGDYVRLAIRSPAASPVLGGEESGPVMLTGLGGHDRLWELSAGAIGPHRRLLRLTDRSAQRAAEKMRVDFVANASHELRTPLAALIGFIETLEDANSPSEAEVRLRFLKIMADEARRMQRLIDDLMSLSRIEADRYSPPRELVDMGLLLREACSDIRAARSDGQRLEIEAEAGAMRVLGDRAQLSQLVHNIVGNALKYGRDDTPVCAALAVEGERVRLTVTDQGEGIAAEHLPRLTERFYRVDPGRSRAVGGTGLGLAIVKHIVERHRGTLEIASTVAKGTSVTVMLPLLPD